MKYGLKWSDGGTFLHRVPRFALHHNKLILLGRYIRSPLMDITPTKNYLVAFSLFFICGVMLLWPQQVDYRAKRIPVELDLNRFISTLSIAETSSLKTTASHTVTIATGDTLSSLFSKMSIDQQTLYQVLEADLNVLALDTLQPGNTLHFSVDQQNELQQLELNLSLAHQVIFTRTLSGSFEVEERRVEGIWRDSFVTGELTGSFYLSAKAVGLSSAQIQRIENLLSEKINFSRDLRAGDKFSVLMSKQYVEGEATGNRDILGVTIEQNRRQIMAFQYQDGQFYDQQGLSLARAFKRVPLNKSYRITSHFNRHRLHPVTGSVSPHNGTDFATPVGTKVIAPGDGIVSRVTEHRYAGKYIEIEHGGRYRTRYLHLSKPLVRKGQRVARGDLIGLSGKSGRITGPHLHYEFLINGRAVDPMKANIPMASSLSRQEMSQFAELVKARQMQMGLI